MVESSDLRHFHQPLKGSGIIAEYEGREERTRRQDEGSEMPPFRINTTTAIIRLYQLQLTALDPRKASPVSNQS